MFLFLSILAISISVPSAGLPTLPPDSKIKAGTLGNGISYYIVANSQGTGKVDIALVQKVGRLDEDKENAGETVVRARSSINELPHFIEHTPFRFMYGKYIWPGSDGYVKVSDNATVYKFSNLSNAAGREMVDSTLLMVFDIIGKDYDVMREVYTPENQAIIVAGDVDVQAILGKMNILSMLVIDKKGSVRHRKYEWSSTDSPEYVSMPVVDKSLASISIDYRLPRLSIENMSTVLPLVSSRYFSELSVLLKKRVSRALRQEGVPVAYIDFNYKGSASSSGDEHYTITIATDRNNLVAATAVVAGVLAELDVNGAAMGEYYDAANEVITSIRRSSLYGDVANGDYVEICTSAFLYGASLASPKTNLDFFINRNIDNEASLSLFNNFVSAILDRSVNLRLICSADDAGAIEDTIKNTFFESWNNKAVDVPYINHIISHNDTIGFRPQRFRGKIKSVATEPVSGGKLISFTNGIKVIYKKIASSGNMLYYSWLLKSGYSQIPELNNGGGAWLSDMFRLYNVAGMTSERFQDMLSANGITIDADVSVADCFIRGSAPSNRLTLLLKAISGLANDRSVDTKAFDYYIKCERLRHKYSIGLEENKAAVLDSILTLENKFSEYKRNACLDKNIQVNAEKFYSQAFSKMNNGVLIITGNIDEAVVKKALPQYVAGFKVGRGSNYRSRIHNKNIAGRATVKKYGKKPSVSIALSAALNQTSENYMASVIAASALKDAVAKAAVIYGWTLDSEWHFSMFPEETFNVDFYLTRASSNGLPASMMPSDSSEMVLVAVRKAISKLGSGGIDSNYLAAGKAEISGLFTKWKNDPAIMRSLIELRYAYGKDLITGFDFRLKSVSTEMVNNIIKALSEGSAAEYIVKLKDCNPVYEAILPEPAFPRVPEMRPACDFTYPFGNMIVPLDTIDLKALELQPMRYYEPDSSYVPLKRNDEFVPSADSTGKSATHSENPKANNPDTLMKARVSPDSLLLNTKTF